MKKLKPLTQKDMTPFKNCKNCVWWEQSWLSGTWKCMRDDREGDEDFNCIHCSVI
jgi:hypothetical protein